MELFHKHYQYLVQRLDPTKVTELMYSKHLLNNKELMVITNAPYDHIKNCMIVEHVRQQTLSYLLVFLNVLQRISNQKYLYDTITKGRINL